MGESAALPKDSLPYPDIALNEISLANPERD